MPDHRAWLDHDVEPELEAESSYKARAGPVLLTGIPTDAAKGQVLCSQGPSREPYLPPIQNNFCGKRFNMIPY
jgi:hypothetical protein